MQSVRSRRTPGAAGKSAGADQPELVRIPDASDIQANLAAYLCSSFRLVAINVYRQKVARVTRSGNFVPPDTISTPVKNGANPFQLRRNRPARPASRLT